MDSTASTITEAPASEGSIALWNPLAAALWSLLLSPAFGAWIHARNWERLGHAGRAREARAWCIGVCVLNAVNIAVNAAASALAWDFSVPVWVGLVLLALWYGKSAHAQVKYVEELHGEAYAHQSWAGPVLAAFGLLVGFVLLCSLVIGVLAP